jgi:hypothetical protein
MRGLTVSLMVIAALINSVAATSHRDVPQGLSFGASLIATYSGTYNFKFEAMYPAGNFLKEDQTVEWQEHTTFDLYDGTISKLKYGDLKLDGSLVATNLQSPGHPADKENCGYSAFPHVRVGPSVSSSGPTSVSVTLSMGAAVPSSAAVISQKGTTTGAYKISGLCQNCKGCGADILMNDTSDNGLLYVQFPPSGNARFAAALEPSGYMKPSPLPQVLKFDYSAVANATNSKYTIQKPYTSVHASQTITSSITIERDSDDDD